MKQNFNTILVAMALLPTLIFIGCSKDEPTTTSPFVEASTPASDALEVAVNTTVAFTFSEEMDAETINTTTVSLSAGATTVAGLVTYSNKVALFTPTVNLDFSTLYTGSISADVTNTDGVAMTTDFAVDFTTGVFVDVTAPSVNATEPLSAATGVVRNKIVSVVFSEAMDPSTINANTFTVMQGTTAQAGVVAYTGTTATFTGDEHFDANTSYSVMITTEAKDLAGNALAENITWDFTTSGSTAVLALVDLGTASDYVILAKTTITNSSASAITGDLGLSPAATSFITGLALVDFTGYATSSLVTGKVYAADMADPTPVTLTTAVNDMTAAYNDASGRPTPDFLELGTGNIGGMTLAPGLYKWTSTVTLASDVTLTGGADDVWIFQIAGDLTQSAAVNITLTGGAQAKNIFWQVAGEATLGTTSHFEGNILSMTGITFLTGASMNGRALAQTAVILDTNAITQLQ